MTTTTINTCSSLMTLVEKALPVNAGLHYSASANMLYTNGYTSLAGNTYYQGFRLSNRIIVNFDLGQGWKYTFLNGVRVYGFDGTSKKLIGSRQFHRNVYSHYGAIQEAERIVREYLTSQMRLLGASCPTSQIENFAKQLVDETCKCTKLLS